MPNFMENFMEGFGYHDYMGICRKRNSDYGNSMPSIQKKHYLVNLTKVVLSFSTLNCLESLSIKNSCR